MSDGFQYTKPGSINKNALHVCALRKTARLTRRLAKKEILKDDSPELQICEQGSSSSVMRTDSDNKISSRREEKDQILNS